MRAAHEVRNLDKIVNHLSNLLKDEHFTQENTTDILSAYSSAEIEAALPHVLSGKSNTGSLSFGRLWHNIGGPEFYTDLNWQVFKGFIQAVSQAEAKKTLNKRRFFGGGSFGWGSILANIVSYRKSHELKELLDMLPGTVSVEESHKVWFKFPHLLAPSDSPTEKAKKWVLLLNNVALQDYPSILEAYFSSNETDRHICFIMSDFFDHFPPAYAYLFIEYITDVKKRFLMIKSPAGSHVKEEAYKGMSLLQYLHFHDLYTKDQLEKGNYFSLYNHYTTEEQLKNFVQWLHNDIKSYSVLTYISFLTAEATYFPSLERRGTALEFAISDKENAQHVYILLEGLTSDQKKQMLTASTHHPKSPLDLAIEKWQPLEFMRLLMLFPELKDIQAIEHYKWGNHPLETLQALEKENPLLALRIWGYALIQSSTSETLIRPLKSILAQDETKVRDYKESVAKEIVKAIAQGALPLLSRGKWKTLSESLQKKYKEPLHQEDSERELVTFSRDSNHFLKGFDSVHDENLTDSSKSSHIVNMKQ